MLDRGVKLGQQHDNGKSPLHFTADQENIKAIGLFIDKRADLTPKNHFRQTTKYMPFNEPKDLFLSQK